VPNSEKAAGSKRLTEMVWNAAPTSYVKATSHQRQVVI
jgi:hypothetical protein